MSRKKELQKLLALLLICVMAFGTSTAFALEDDSHYPSNTTDIIITEQTGETNIADSSEDPILEPSEDNTDEVTPAGDEVTPVEDEITSTEDEVTSAEDEVTSAEDEVTPVEDEEELIMPFAAIILPDDDKYDMVPKYEYDEMSCDEISRRATTN